jgi:hypothetical protein
MSGFQLLRLDFDRPTSATVNWCPGLFYSLSLVESSK